MTLVIIFGLLFLAGLLLDAAVESEKVYDSHSSNFASALLIGGFILSSLAFNDLNSTLKRYHYLTLPASTFEKFLCMWLLTSVGWIVFFTITYTLYTMVANAVGTALFSHMTFQTFEPLDEFSKNTMKAYFVLQGIFMLGAAHFKGYVFPKTLLALILFLSVCGTLIYFILEEAFFTDHDCGYGQCALLNQMKIHNVWAVTQSIFWWALAPLCWITTYFGLKDQEV